MNKTEIYTRINQKLSHFSSEQLNSVWQFIESIESQTETIAQDSTKTILERMGGYPQHLLEGLEDLSDRERRKTIIAKKIRKKHQGRH